MFEEENREQNFNENTNIENPTATPLPDAPETPAQGVSQEPASEVPQGFVLVGEPRNPEEPTQQATERKMYSYIPEEPVKKQASGRKKKEKKKKGHPFLKAIGCALLCGIIIGGCIIGSYAIGKNVVPTYTTVETTSAKLSVASEDTASDTQTGETTSSGTEYSVAEIAEQCSSSVVAITSKSVSEVITMFGIYEQESSGSGSGVIVSQTDTELLIVTNYHVIEDSDELTVCMLDSEEAVYSAQIKGTAESNDLAVLAVSLSDMDEEVLNQISIATIGDSDSLKVGDNVVAIGNALGLGQSVTAGIISALDREITIDNTTYCLLQTDAAINAGNSGGALFNMKGELIGINTAKFSSDSDSSSASIDNMGFAIPMSIAQPIIEELMNLTTRTKLESDYGCLNITGTDVSSEVAQIYGMPEGVYVVSVVEGGAAEQAGIQAGDIITALDGSSLTSIDTLKERLQYYAAGETVEITLQRANNGTYESYTVTVKLDNASEQTTTTETTTEQDTQSSQNSQSIPDSQNSQGSSGNGMMGR